MPRETSVNLEELLVKWEPQVRAAFLKAVQTVVDRIDVKRLEKLIGEGNITAAVELVGLNPLDFRGLDQALTAAYNESGTKSEKAIPPQVNLLTNTEIAFLFDIRNLNAETQVRNRTGQLITEMVEDQKEVIRQHLTQGLVEGKNPVDTATNLAGRINKVTGKREGGVIGLTSQQEKWQANLEKELDKAHLFRGDPKNFPTFERELRDKRFDAAIKKAIATGKPIPAELKERMLMAYRNKSLKYRANTIARNETMRAIGAAQTETYRQAIEKGHVYPSDIRRYWMTAGDEHVRHTHRLIPGMNPDGVGWEEPFKTPTGDSMHAPHDRDIQCRCREKIKVNYFARVNRGIVA